MNSYHTHITRQKRAAAMDAQSNYCMSKCVYCSLHTWHAHACVRARAHTHTPFKGKKFDDVETTEYNALEQVLAITHTEFENWF
jgi:hypothetical protein